ncbi:tryptophan halogenase [Rubellimicrobium mesophilum DSM 19309]|uniref:Tryptophan halogenase n=1 Tax=Rubellimicrobium mesophilum DSM 19309 TaxID=442562 RepID=A0A017HUU0_9RHOB|nr:tryptophan 7-halogenase [Rubellimicrobium mesophilum]EYD78065.1 tryptophan halogenase [Rubellimicrobium mesophilum DSM 19309]
MAGGWPERIVVVGGGTAGWLAAMMLSEVAGRKAPGTSVTVVESSKIPVIGVGEGSTAVFRQMLRRFGLDEEEFLRETGATIKFGIRHRDWRRLGHHYDGPIDDPHLVAPGCRWTATPSRRGSRCRRRTFSST